MEKKNLTNSRRLKFPWNERTDKYFTAQPKINLQSFKNTLDYPKRWFKALREDVVPLKTFPTKLLTD